MIRPQKPFVMVLNNIGKLADEPVAKPGQESKLVCAYDRERVFSNRIDGP